MPIIICIVKHSMFSTRLVQPEKNFATLYWAASLLDLCVCTTEENYRNENQINQLDIGRL